jgi:hypothetical protein
MNNFSFLIIISLSICNCEIISKSIELMKNVNLTYRYRMNETDFEVSASFGNNRSLWVNSAWLGIGLNHYSEMDGANVVVCTNLNGNISIEHYYNSERDSRIMNELDPTLGLTNMSLMIKDNKMICKFTRDNFNRDAFYYYDLKNGSAPFILIAYGENQIDYHGRNKYITPKGIKFQQEFMNNNKLASNTTKIKIECNLFYSLLILCSLCVFYSFK